MIDIDMILSMVNNPTRRRILEALVKEPRYPLQLSKELGVSQQAVMKNLDLLEKNGMVISHQESSTIGPMRTVYSPTSEFTLVIDMRNCMFTTNVIEEDEEEKECVIPETEDLDDVRRQLTDLDNEIDALEKERSVLIRKREQIISYMMDRLNSDEFAYEHRNLMYHLLNEPDVPVNDIIGGMTPNGAEIENKLKDIVKAMSR